MSVKTWVLHRVQGIGAAAGRSDLPPRDSRHAHEPDLGADAGTTIADFGGGRNGAEPALAADPLRAGADLGVYAPLIGAVRDELEHFVASHVRLHVVIAERDRFLLTSIGVRSPGGAEARDLLQQFMLEFRPEQVKRYLAREVIGRLPNAAVIDLSQFAGLADLEAGERSGEEGEYRELLAALRTTPAPLARPYEVSVIGRWSEAEPAGAAPGHGRRLETPSTPLAGRRAEFDIEDAGGARRAALGSVVPGRRYVVGKDERCDLRVEGTYTSRRHAEIWLDADGWQVADAGSTNGLRIEAAPAADGTPGAVVATAASGAAAPIRVGAGMRIVLSARAEGPAGDYPSIALRPPSAAAAAATPSTPIAAVGGAPKTPLTSVLAVRPVARFEVTATQASGGSVHPLTSELVPWTVGRSRGQAVVIDRRHQGVSGQHVAIDAVDEHGAHGTVHGDNGIAVAGVRHAAGDRFEWRPGQSMVLGGSLPGEPPCTLVLARAGEG